MCTGLEIAAIVSTVGGTYLQGQSQKKAQDRQRKAAQAEALRQGKFDEEKFANFQKALEDVGREDQQGVIDDAASTIEEELATNVAVGDTGSYEPAAASRAPRIVKEHAQGQQAKADDFISLLGNARARRGAWTENQFDFAQNQLDRNFDQSRIQTNLDRSAQIGAAEAQQAGQIGPGAAIGNALVGLGSAGLGYAGSQGSFNNIFGSTPVVKSAGNVATSYPLNNPELFKGVNII